jgi:hypothetical protein
LKSYILTNVVITLRQRKPGDGPLRDAVSL